MALRTYTKQKYGLTKPYRDNLNKMEKGLTKNESLISDYANNLYNNEVNRMNKVKQEYQDVDPLFMVRVLSRIDINKLASTVFNDPELYHSERI